MNIELFREYCLSKAHTTEDTPFDETTLAFRVGGKIYALTSLDSINPAANLKCDPEKAIELREMHPGSISPGYHMNKKHWNTVLVDELDDSLVTGLVDHSYELVFNSLSKKAKETLLSTDA
jgi:predicted DNA-binding protein (MmcQ/YjbR family)